MNKKFVYQVGNNKKVNGKIWSTIVGPTTTNSTATTTSLR